jgi:hypothetical protein
VADDPTPTPTSEPTPTPAPNEPPAGDPPAAEPGKVDDPAPKQDEGDDLAGTALGNDPKPNEGDDPKPSQAAVPEAYELAVPDGFEKLDEAAVAAATPVFKELGLSNEQANKLMPVVGEYAKRIVAERDEKLMGTILEQRKDWLETARKDPEIGGNNWDATMREGARALDQLGFPKGSPLRNALDESGFGNHPEMIRFAAKVGKAIGEDSDFVRPDANASVKPKTDAELFYGTQSKG